MGLRLLVGLVAVLASACSYGIVDEQAPDKNEGDEALVTVPKSGTGNFMPPAEAEEEKTETRPGVVANGGPLFRASFDGTLQASLNSFDRYEAALQADGTLTIATKKGAPGVDPEPTGYYGGSFYNGGAFRYATVVSPAWIPYDAFDTVTPSFEALTPPGTWVEVYVSAHLVATGEWTKEYSLGVWAHDASTVRRHSVVGQKDVNGDVVTDRLELASKADALHVSVLLFSADETTTPSLRAVSAITSLTGAKAKAVEGDRTSWGKTLDVPKHAQTDATWSSPTSTSMLLRFWGVDTTPADAAALSNDVVNGGPGNELFDTAFASAMANGDLHSMVTRLGSIAQVEPLVAKGIPVAIGVTYADGELRGAPLARATGHVLVVKGFTASGAVIVNDPGFATDDAVETTYDRAELAAAFARAGGTTYLAWPQATKLPADPLGAY